jgi:FKBP-type peptidyl-prolyl cis-trans isomerase
MKLYQPLTVTLLIVCSGCGTTTEKNQKKNEVNPAVKPSKEVMKPVLQYKILQPAKDPNARSPQPGETVIVHYTGWLADKDGNPMMNAKFDSSIDRGTPFSFVIGRGMVIRGWDEGVRPMKIGEKRRLIIPAELAYGTRGAGDVIPPNATLVFDIELLDIR